MIVFEKSIDRVLPYNRVKYRQFLNEECNLNEPGWVGVSLQCNRVIHSMDAFVELFEPLVLEIIELYENGNCWIVNHDDKDLKWIPEINSNLSCLKNEFTASNIPFSFKGGLLLELDSLQSLIKDFLAYPLSAFSEEGSFYKNLDISHWEKEFIIKITSHATIDLLSTSEFELSTALKRIEHGMLRSRIEIKHYRSSVH